MFLASSWAFCWRNLLLSVPYDFTCMFQLKEFIFVITFHTYEHV
jgi:hypothetical protein